MGTPAYCWFVRCAEPWALPAYWDEPGVPGRQSCAAAYAVLWGYPCPPCAYAEWACERLLCPCPCECPCPLCPCECTCPWVGVPEREMDPPARCSASGTYWQSMPFFLQRSQRGVSPVHCDRGRGRESVIFFGRGLVWPWLTASLNRVRLMRLCNHTAALNTGRYLPT